MRIDSMNSVLFEQKILVDTINNELKKIYQLIKDIDQETNTHNSIADMNFTELNNSVLELKEMLQKTLDQLDQQEIHIRELDTILNTQPPIPSIKCDKIIDKRDGKEYKTVVIGKQCWMAENLNATVYPDGKSIPLVTNNKDWADLDDNYTADAYCYINNNTSSESVTYGALYTWVAAMGGNAVSSNKNPSGIQGVCPSGWHLPSDKEWQELEMALGMSQPVVELEMNRGNEGRKLAGNTSLWEDFYFINKSDFGSSGFNALPAGYRENYFSGDFHNQGLSAYFWSSTVYSSDRVWFRSIGGKAMEDTIYRYGFQQTFGFSVRCVKD